MASNYCVRLFPKRPSCVERHPIRTLKKEKKRLTWLSVLKAAQRITNSKQSENSLMTDCMTNISEFLSIGSSLRLTKYTYVSFYIILPKIRDIYHV